MRPVEVYAALEWYGINQEQGGCPFTREEVLAELHTNYKAFDLLWCMIDQGDFKVGSLSKTIDWSIGYTAAIADPKEKIDWVRDHGLGELMFYSAWRMWRTGQVDLAHIALQRAVKYFNENNVQPLAWLGSLIEEERADSTTHDTVPLLTLVGQRVAVPDDVEGAVMKIVPDDRWTN